MNYNESWSRLGSLRKHIRTFLGRIRVSAKNNTENQKKNRKPRSVEVIATIQNSGLFDSEWYLEHYGSVMTGGVDPITHYVLHGAEDGLNPSGTFDTRFYIEANPDVAQSGLNPLFHFAKWGLKEGRICHSMKQSKSGVETAATFSPRTKVSRPTLSFGAARGSAYDIGFEQIEVASALLESLRLGRFILHASEGVDSLHHIDIWIDFIREVDAHVIVVIRSRNLYERVINERPEVNALYVRSGREAEWVIEHAPGLCAILYTSNTGNNVHFLRYRHIKHVFIGHGDSEKSASCGKQFRSFDEVWVAGRAHIDRFRNSLIDFSSIRFRVVGRPLLCKLLESSHAASSTKFLYLPTWEGYQNEQNYSSVEISESFISKISSATRLKAVVKFHPFTGKRIKSLPKIELSLQQFGKLKSGAPRAGLDQGQGFKSDPRQNNEIDIMPDGDHHSVRNQVDLKGAAVKVCDQSESATALMEDAAFMVADISSVVSDFLVTGLPIFLYVPQGREIGGSSSSVSMDEYCYIYSTTEELLSLVNRVIVEKHDTLKESRISVRNYFVDIKRTKKHQFQQELENMIPRTESGGGANRETPAGAEDEPRSIPSAPLLVAHRGVTRRYPENSIGAFNDAKTLSGLDAVEFDVHATSDGEIVVMHDADLSRTTDGKGLIREATLADIKQLRLKTRDGLELEDGDSTVPTLDEVLDILAPTELELHIEIKNDSLGRAYPGLAERVVEDISRRGLVDRCVLTSFSPSVLEDIRYLDGEVRLLASVNMNVLEALGGYDAAIQRIHAIENCMIAFDRKVLKAIQKGGPDQEDLRQFGAWVINDEQELEKALRTGYRQITTDKPEMAIEVRHAAA